MHCSKQLTQVACPLTQYGSTVSPGAWGWKCPHAHRWKRPSNGFAGQRINRGQHRHRCKQVPSRCAWWQPHITAHCCSLLLLVQPVGTACCPAQTPQSCRLVCLPVVVIARCGNTLRFYITPHCIKCMPVSRQAPLVVMHRLRALSGLRSRRYAKLPTLAAVASCRRSLASQASPTRSARPPPQGGSLRVAPKATHLFPCAALSLARCQITCRKDLASPKWGMVRAEQVG